MKNLPLITPEELMERYEVILLDAYGVLITQNQVVPGAADFIAELNHRRKPYYILTNDASRSIEAASQRFYTRGLPIAGEHIITAGSLLKDYFAENGLQGSHCAVLGPADSLKYVEEAGGIIVPVLEDSDIDILLICDEEGFPFLETVDTALTILFRKFDRGESVKLLLPNPDLIYPKSPGRYGITSGSIALVLEAALRLRYPHKNLLFTKLGKPFEPIYRQAYQRSGTKNMVMVGDQLYSDIQGARNFGIASVLIGTGLTKLGTWEESDLAPDYLLPSWTNTETY